MVICFNFCGKSFVEKVYIDIFGLWKLTDESTENEILYKLSGNACTQIPRLPHHEKQNWKFCFHEAQRISCCQDTSCRNELSSIWA